MARKQVRAATHGGRRKTRKFFHVPGGTFGSFPGPYPHPLWADASMVRIGKHEWVLYAPDGSEACTFRRHSRAAGRMRTPWTAYPIGLKYPSGILWASHPFPRLEWGVAVACMQGYGWKPWCSGVFGYLGVVDPPGTIGDKIFKHPFEMALPGDVDTHTGVGDLVSIGLQRGLGTVLSKIVLASANAARLGVPTLNYRVGLAHFMSPQNMCGRDAILGGLWFLVNGKAAPWWKWLGPTSNVGAVEWRSNETS